MCGAKMDELFKRLSQIYTQDDSDQDIDSFSSGELEAAIKKLQDLKTNVVHREKRERKKESSRR